MRVRGLTTVSLSVSWLVLVVATLSLVSNLDSTRSDAALQVFAVIWVWCCGVTVRAHMLGVWLSEEGLECVSWLRKRSFPWDGFARLLAEPYAGFMSKGARTALFSEVAVVTTSGRTIPLPGVVGLSRRVLLETRRVSRPAAIEPV